MVGAALPADVVHHRHLRSGPPLPLLGTGSFFSSFVSKYSWGDLILGPLGCRLGGFVSPVALWFFQKRLILPEASPGSDKKRR